FHRALERGYNPLMYTFPREGAEERELLRYADGRSDAFVLLWPPLGSPLLSHLQKLAMPTVTVCSRPNHPRARWVDSDNEAGIRMAIEHVKRLGHRRLAYLHTGNEVGNKVDRLQAFVAATSEPNSGVEKTFLLEHDWSPEGTTALLKKIF